MSQTLETTLLFAAHMLALFVALGTALVLANEPDRGRLTRTAGFLGLVALAAAESYHGAGFAGEADVPVLITRAAGYFLLIVAAIPTPAAGVAAVFPAQAVGVIPAALGLVAGALNGWRRRGERGGVWLGVGVMLLAIADSALVMDRDWAETASHVVRVAGYGAIGVFSYTLSRHSIRFRMVTGFVALLLAVVIAISSAVTQVLAGNLRQSVLRGVTQQAADALAEIARRGEAVVTNVSLFDAVFLRQLEQGGRIDDETPRFLLGLFGEIDFIVVLDSRGRPLQSVGLADASPTQVAGTTTARAVIRGGVETTTLDTFGENNLALIGAQPVEGKGGETLAVVVTGTVLDEDVLARVVPPGTVAAVFAGTDPVPVGSTFPVEPGTPLLARSQLADLSGRALSASTPPGDALEIGGEPYFAAAAPIIREPDTPIGTLVVAQPASLLADAQRGITSVIFVVALGAAIVALMLALLVSRRITRPVVALTGAARRVQGGDLAVRAETRGEDEVADLGRAFNSMTQSVTAMTEELRDAAEEQARLRARLETVVNSMGDGLIAVNDAGRIVTYNPAAGAIVGLPRSRVVGKPIRDVLRGRTSDGRPLLRARGSPNGLAFVRRNDGEDVPVAITSSPLRDGAGTALGRVYVLRDMTREHQVERMKSEFLSNVSHELRTPLTPIIGYSELLARRPAAPDQAQEFAGGILESAKRLERVVGMLVDFSAIEAGRMALSTERVQLGPVIRGSVEAWKGRSSTHRVTAKVPRALPEADVDVSLIRRIVDELIDNAIKYSPDGGRVTVSVSTTGRGKGRMLRADVSDEGIGIEPEDLARIFQDFRQLDASDTRMFGGLGLGLTFVKRIVEAHGGAVDATSTPGRGSTFSFTVPAADTKGNGGR